MPTRSCGCATAQCNCVLRSSDGSVDIEGNGTPLNPYDITIGDFPLTGRLQVLDSDSIDLNLEGSGTVDDPWILTAETSLELGDLTDVDASNLTAGYVLARAGDGTFHMVPAPTALPGAIMTDASIDGDGSAGIPLAVHDYDRIAWLTGADNLPNEGDLILGDPSLAGFGYRFVSSSNLPNAEASEAVFSLSQRIIGGVGNIRPDARIVVSSNESPDQATFSHMATGQEFVSVRNPAGDTRTFWKPWLQWSTRVIIQGTGSDSAAVNVVFPAGMFTDGPGVGDDGTSFLTVTANRNTLQDSTVPYVVTITNLTAAGCTVRLNRLDGGTFSATHGVGIQVMQMDPSIGWT